MISNIEITGIGGYKISDDTKDYITRKIGKLSRFMPISRRRSARAEVKIEKVDLNGNKFEVEAIIILTDKKISAKEMSPSILASVDIVEQKIAIQLKRYKSESIIHIGHRKLLSKFKRSYDREQ